MSSSKLESDATSRLLIDTILSRVQWDWLTALGVMPRPCRRPSLAPNLTRVRSAIKIAFGRRGTQGWWFGSFARTSCSLPCHAPQFAQRAEKRFRCHYPCLLRKYDAQGREREPPPYTTSDPARAHW